MGMNTNTEAALQAAVTNEPRRPRPSMKAAMNRNEYKTWTPDATVRMMARCARVRSNPPAFRDAMAHNGIVSNAANVANPKANLRNTPFANSVEWTSDVIWSG